MTLDEHRGQFFSALMRRTYTEHEARALLRKRSVPDDDAELLMEEACGMSLVNDTDYARLFAGSHESWGRRRIEAELRMRGISDDCISAATEDIDETERAAELAEEWKKSGIEMRKIMGRLARRGFDSRVISAVCSDNDCIPW